MLAFDPEDQSPGDIYKLMVGAIVPRPIALVSSQDESGVRNLAPFSYFTACSSNPPVVVSVLLLDARVFRAIVRQAPCQPDYCSPAPVARLPLRETEAAGANSHANTA